MSKMISITENGHILCNEPINAQEISSIFLNGILQVFNDIVNQQETEENKKECKEELYDMFNAQASTLLEVLIPDKELRPDLTAEAILKMENEILDEADASNGKLIEFPAEPVNE